MPGAGSHLAVRRPNIEPDTTVPMDVSLERTSVFVQGSEIVDVVTRVEGQSRVSTGQSLPAGSGAACTMATVMAASSALRRSTALRGTLRTLTPDASGRPGCDLEGPHGLVDGMDENLQRSTETSHAAARRSAGHACMPLGAGMPKK
jgi:hypothetical protein